MAGIDGITNLDASALNRFLKAEAVGYAIKACTVSLSELGTDSVTNINGFDEVITEPSTDVFNVDFDANFTATPIVIPCVQNPNGLTPMGYAVEMHYVSGPANLTGVRFNVVKDNLIVADAELTVGIVALGKVGDGVEDDVTPLNATNLNKKVSSEHTTKLFVRGCVVTLNGASPAIATVSATDGSGISVASAAGVYTLTSSVNDFANEPVVLFGVQSHNDSVKGFSVERMYESDALNLSEIKFKVVKDNAHVTDANCHIHVLMIGRIV